MSKVIVNEQEAFLIGNLADMKASIKSGEYQGHDEYLMGFYNGMELALSNLQGRKPKYMKNEKKRRG